MGDLIGGSPYICANIYIYMGYYIDGHHMRGDLKMGDHVDADINKMSDPFR